MAKKRKLETPSSDVAESSQKQKQKQTEEDQKLEIKKEPDAEDSVHEEVEEDPEEDPEEEEEEDDDDDDDDDDDSDDNQKLDNRTEAPATSGSGNQEDGNDDEPISDLLEPFSKEQLLNLLKEAAEKDVNVANRIREVADEDPVHRKIFVHGLGWDTKTETLIEAFKQYGQIEDCKAVFDKISGKSKGYGFILFKSRSGARNALKQPQKKIGNRMTACQLASKGPVFGGAPVAGAAAVSAPAQFSNSEHTQKKIYVSNVGAEIDPQKLLAFFSKFGEIEEGPLGLDKFTGRPKGFCLFVYKSAESAKKALEEPHKTFEGVVLHCQKAIDGPKVGKQQHHHNPHSQNNPRFQRNDNSGYGNAGGQGHFMAGNQADVGGPASQMLNPAIGQALTAILASQGAGLAYNPAIGQALLGSLGTPTGVNPGSGAVMPTGYGTPGTMPGYSTPPGLQGGYQTPRPGQGNTGRGKYGVGSYGTPYMGQ